MRQGYSYLNEYNTSMVKSEIERLHFASKIDEENINECLTILNFNGKKKLLDLGCGPASSTMSLHNFNRDGHIIGADNEEEFIRFAREYVKENEIKNVTYVVGDGRNLPFENAEFDICFSRFLFQHVLKVDSVFKELMRITKKGGKIGIYENDESLTCYYPEPRHYKKYINAKRNLRRFSGGDIFLGKKLYSLFMKHDLDNIKVKRLFRDIYYPGRDKLSKSVFWNDDINENHPYVKFKFMTFKELLEYKEDLEKIIQSPESYISFGGYFVCGEKK